MHASKNQPAAAAWWQQTVEPIVLGMLVLAACTLPLAVLANLLTMQAALRVAIGLLWLAGLLALPRLPRLLHREQHRVGLLALIGTTAVVLLLIAQAKPATVTPAYADTSSTPLDREHPVPATTAADTAAPVAAAPVAAPLAQNGSPTMVSPPRISRELFARLLWDGIGGGGTSPAAPHADELYDIIVGYGLDPAIALAFFAQESQFCTTGMCISYDMKNWGGQRAAVNPNRVTGVVYNSTGPFVIFASWQEGMRDWCELILYRYVNRGLVTVADVIPVYAPASDGNDEQVYIDNVHRRVAAWQGRDPEFWIGQDLRRYPDLATGLMMETFQATELEYHPTWAFHQFVMQEARAGRPLGSPIGESTKIYVNGRRYAIQTFALDTLYTPIASIEERTNWSDVRRMSNLLQTGEE
ncbi:MAG: glucosaminidase domain-containing protein [Chloroflexaceae bacterium]|nr:glucosaminidase domain-containing protein [Chloroflexaceae bacterium]